ncbi:hypothetical protein [Streptomyces chrestomyceticus]|uniref:Uncharacterized protein n=1 Tax=Streptomyces chrestomyceticus TaxID=68185 RepID=A0ABU7WQQ9_9ACTN
MVRRALSAAVREEFGQAFKDVVLREGVYVVGLWWGAFEVAGSCGEGQVRQAATGTLQAYALQG